MDANHELESIIVPWTFCAVLMFRFFLLHVFAFSLLLIVRYLLATWVRRACQASHSFGWGIETLDIGISDRKLPPRWWPVTNPLVSYKLVFAPWTQLRLIDASTALAFGLTIELSRSGCCGWFEFERFVLCVSETVRQAVFLIQQNLQGMFPEA